MFKQISVVIVLALSLFTTHCSSDYGFSHASMDQKLTVSLTGDPEVIPAAPVTDEGTSTDETWDGTDPEVPVCTESEGTPDDTDGDGIDNSEDDNPTVCTNMTVTTHGGAASAKVVLNDNIIFEQSDFTHADLTLYKNVNLLSGGNTLNIWLAAKPGGQVNVRIYNCSTNPSTLLFETTVTRAKGAPDTSADAF